MDKKCIHAVMTAKKTGNNDVYNTFVSEKLIVTNRNVFYPLKKAKWKIRIAG